METFGLYKYRILRNAHNKWFYQIIDGSTTLRESKDFFDHEEIARYAAIGHITLLEQGEG